MIHEMELCGKVYFMQNMHRCLERNALVTMADGSEKIISELRVGESIRGKDGPDRIVNIVAGYEEALILLHTMDHYELKMTNAHPVLTDKGYRRAGELESGERVLLIEGKTIPVESIEEISYQDIVYNLELESNRCFFANNIAVGDFQCQNCRLE